MVQSTFQPVDISIKLAIAIGIGMLVGLEREWSQKDLGTRTFGITAMAGTLSVLAAPAVAYITFAGILLIVALAALRNVHDGKPVETTTSVAVIVTFVLGILVGQGHHYTPVAAAIVMTMLLSLKPALTHFAGDLKVSEVRSGVLPGSARIRELSGACCCSPANPAVDYYSQIDAVIGCDRRCRLGHNAAFGAILGNSKSVPACIIRFLSGTIKERWNDLSPIFGCCLL